MKHVKSVIALTVICAVIAVLLAVTNSITKPMIDKNAAAEANAALLVVYPDADGFTQVDLSKYKLPATITEAYTTSDGGCVIKLETTGYASGMILMCGINPQGEIVGATCLSSGETNGVEKTYGESTVGKTVDTIDGLETVASSTKTSTAYKNAMKDALNTALILGGATVDVRTEAEILNDNLSAALPTADGKFVSWFMVEALENVTAVYEAENGAGYVMISGEEFIAIDENGKILTDVSDDVKSIMENNAQLIVNSSVTEIDITGYENMPKNVIKAYKTETGNYVFELQAAGWGINGEYDPNISGKPIEIKASVTAEGNLISVYTVAQYETSGKGEFCAEPSYYTQYNGKDEAGCNDIEVVAGSTITSNGYKEAVLKVFEAVEILKGEA